MLCIRDPVASIGPMLLVLLTWRLLEGELLSMLWLSPISFFI